jgi:retinol dehydrogenase 14
VRLPWAWPGWVRVSRSVAESAAREIREAGNGQVDLLVADLSSQSEIRWLAEEVLQSLSRIDVLINNVGGYWNTRHVTADGLERTFALNHLAPILLTNLLLDRLRLSAPARVVTVSSKCGYHGANQLRRPPVRMVLLEHAGLQPVQACPRPDHLRVGHKAASHLGHGQCAASRCIAHIVRSRGPRRHPATARPIPAAVHEDPAQGAATSIHLATVPELERVTGRYFANKKPTRSSKRSYDEAEAAQLRQVSAKLVGLNPAG